MKPAEMVTVADLNCCALCPLPESAHPVLSFGHMDDTKKRAYHAQGIRRTIGRPAHPAPAGADGRPVRDRGGPSGDRRTHNALRPGDVPMWCNCASHREQAPHARCSACVMADVEARS